MTDRAALSNGVLIEKFIQGDPEARERLVELARPIIEIAARRTLQTCAPPLPDVADIVQDVYVRIFLGNCQALRSFDPAKSSLPTWLSTLTHNITLDLIRKLRANTRLTVHAVPADPPVSRASAMSGNSTLLSEVAPRVLTAREQLVLRLLFDDELSVDEAARFMSINEQTVRSTKSRALLKLRAHLNQSK